MSGVSHIVSARSAEGAGFLNKYLEIRENRVNTHTHTGLARQYTANHLIHKYLAENLHLPQTSPPCGNALAETFIYPRNCATHVNAVPAGFRGFLYPTANR